MVPADSLPSWLTGAHAIDLALVLIVLLGALGGWRRGFIAGGLQLLALVAAVLVAFAAYEPAAAWLRPWLPHVEEWAVPIAFLLVFGVAYALLGALARALIRAMPRRAHIHPANCVLGLLPGAVNGLIIATIAAVLLLTVPLFDPLGAAPRDSVLANALVGPAEWAESRLEPVFETPVRRAMHSLMVPAESRAFIELPFKSQDARDRPDLEAQLLQMLNAERTRHGLRPLAADPELTLVARAHSRDMLARGYFSHASPDRRDPFDRMRDAHVPFLTAGENLAFAPDLTAAHESLMNSAGHRANILRAQFGRVGIGVEDAGRRGLMITQDFRN